MLGTLNDHSMDTMGDQTKEMQKFGNAKSLEEMNACLETIKGSKNDVNLPPSNKFQSFSTDMPDAWGNRKPCKERLSLLEESPN